MQSRLPIELQVDVFERRPLQAQVVEPRAGGAQRIGEADDRRGGIGGAIAEERAVAAFEGRPAARGGAASTVPVHRRARASTRRPRAPSSSSGVPSATISPADRMITRSASASISSR